MPIQIDHTALYVSDLEGMRSFYERYFGAQANDRYHNPKTGLTTYFLTLGEGSRLELMTCPGLRHDDRQPPQAGYAHLALSLGSRDAVDRLTARLLGDGFEVLSYPRVTGDGYYESCVLDPEGNRLELVG